ncbi:MAG: hypothetical protein KDD45_15210, partial [Bdellovibrionales bacterium]|nr:hypothetical protein [Bdellovibrionales bacterium]
MDADKNWIVKTSFGSTWGDSGYITLPLGN